MLRDSAVPRRRHHPATSVSPSEADTTRAAQPRQALFTARRRQFGLKETTAFARGNTPN